MFDDVYLAEDPVWYVTSLSFLTAHGDLQLIQGNEKLQKVGININDHTIWSAH